MAISPTASEHFGIDELDLRLSGALDVPLSGPEANVYIDPRLLRLSAVPEFDDAMADVADHYALVFQDIDKANALPRGKAREAHRQRALRNLHFPELPGLRIGYGKGKSAGRGISKKRAETLYGLANTFVKDEFQDPILFEMFTIVEKGVGADLISDMVAFIARKRLYAFSQRIGQEFAIPAQTFIADDVRYQLPWNPYHDEPILFPPQDSVADIPAFGRSSHHEAFTFNNQSLREAFSEWIKKHSSATWREFLKKNPEHVKTALAAYKQYQPLQHDAYTGASGAALAGRELYVRMQAQLAPVRRPDTPQDLHAAVAELCALFKADVEAGRARRQLHANDGPRDEKHVQGMFRMMAVSFCKDRDIKISPESDSGVGPVDFQFDRGAHAVTIVEVKLSTNDSLIEGYQHQVGAYARANGAHTSFYYVVDLSGEAKRLAELVKVHDEKPDENARPHLFVVDGRQTPSASKIRKALESLPQPATQPKHADSVPVV